MPSAKNFVSDLRGIPLIDDTNWQRFARKPGSPDWTGYIERDWNAQPLGSLRGTTAFPSSLLIPRSEWPARIEELDAPVPAIGPVQAIQGQMAAPGEYEFLLVLCRRASHYDRSHAEQSAV